MTDGKNMDPIAGLALVRDRRMLLVRKRGLSALILPGGKVEKDEPGYTALQRELQEELGTQLLRHTVSHLGIFTGPTAGQGETSSVRVDLYTGLLRDEPVAAGEIEALVWVDLDDYEDLDLAPSLRLKILPYVAGTLPLRAGLPWLPRPSDCRACGQTLAFNCRDCQPGEDEFCDREGCASGRAINGHNVPFIRTDPPDVNGARRVLDLVGSLEDRIVGPGYMLLSRHDYQVLAARADRPSDASGHVTFGAQPDDKLYEIHTMVDGRVTLRGTMTAAEAAVLGSSGTSEGRQSSGSSVPSVQAIPRSAPHLAKIFERPDAAIGPRLVSAAYDGSDITYLPVDPSPFARQLYAGDVSGRQDTGDSPEPASVSGGHTAPGPFDEVRDADTSEESRPDVWFWVVVVGLAVAGLMLLWNYVAEPLIFT